MGFAAVWNSHPKDHSKGGRDWCVRSRRSVRRAGKAHCCHLRPTPLCLPLRCVA